jgi:hypothetical protein
MNTALISVAGGGLALSALLAMAMRYGSTTITVAPAGACLCPETVPPASELTPTAAAELHERHRNCPACPTHRLAREALDSNLPGYRG